MNISSHKVLITGGDGQMGNALRHYTNNPRFNLIFCSHQQLDITDASAIDLAITQYQPDFIINTAAYTAVDRAEQEKDLAMTINYQGTKNLALACATHSIPLIHLSTDYVFNGMRTTAYSENDIPDPINFYGESKLLGEKAIQTHCTRYLILRLSGVFSEYGTNFFKTILQLAQEKKSLTIVSDQITCPTYAKDIASTLLQLIQYQFTSSHWGIYHYCSTQPTSWYQFAAKIIESAKKYRKIKYADLIAITAEQYGAKAKRGSYSVLNCDKIKKIFNIEQPQWSSALALCLEQLWNKS